MKIIFFILCLFHVLIWIFCLLAFTNKEMAYYNIYYMIPCIYILHILPFHMLVTLKKNIYPDTYKIKINLFYKYIFLDKYFKFKDILDNYCTFNPLSPQGMMCFGLITCIYKLYPPLFIQHKN